MDKARAALTVSDACPDAHVLLALYDAASLDDALQHYRTAEACAPAALQAGEKLVDTLESVPVRRVPRANTPTDGVVCSGVCVCVCVWTVVVGAAACRQCWQWQWQDEVARPLDPPAAEHP